MPNRQKQPKRYQTKTTNRAGSKIQKPCDGIRSWSDRVIRPGTSYSLRGGLCDPFIDSARPAFDHPGVNPAGDRGKDLGRPLLSETADATDIRSFELLGQLGKHRSPINPAPASAGSAAPCFGSSGHQSQSSLFFPETLELGFFSANLLSQANQQLSRLFLDLTKS